MSAIITDQLRVLNAANFAAGIKTTTNSYYSFINLPNAIDVQSDWDTNVPDPVDSFREEDRYWDTMIALKKINAGDVKRVIRKLSWTSGTTYDYYRDDYSRNKTASQTGASNLYGANYYVMNSDYRVYICVSNGYDPDNLLGRPSLDEPLHTDLEPKAAGTSGDGYLWKYLYTINPGDLIKFESTNFIPVPDDWETTTDANITAVRGNAALSGNQLKNVVIDNRGAGYGNAATYTNVPINGNGNGAKCSVTINASGQVESVSVTQGGDGYTYGTVDLTSGGVTNTAGSTDAVFKVVIPPQGGHGADVYRELGATRVLVYSRIENDDSNPDFVTGNQFARVGMVKNPQETASTTLLSATQASAVYALRLTGAGVTAATFTADARVRQTVGVGSTAVGQVVSWDANTRVLKYWQSSALAGFTTAGIAKTNPDYGFELYDFASTVATGGTTIVSGGSVDLQIDLDYTGITTVINNKTYNLGQTFTNGVAPPEVKKYSGEVIYVDNRASITRSTNQKEDIKIIVEF
jgi:hypothetical protein